MIKCVIFDKDGVLINSEPQHYRAWKRVFRERGLEIDYEHYKAVIGSTNQFLCDLIMEGYGVSFHNDEKLSPRFHEINQEIVDTEGVPRIEGVPEVIEYLHQKGYVLAVASSSPQSLIESDTRAVGVDHYFKLMFSAEKVEKPKPAPDVFLETARQLGFRPDECIVIEDSTNGTRAARAAGMKCLGFANPDSGDQDLSAADEIFYPFIKLKELL